MKTTTHLVLPLFYALTMCACSNNDDYPKGYVGFERGGMEHSYDVNHREETITLKIISAEKKNENRKMKLAFTSEFPAAKMETSTLVIEKGKKWVKVDIKIYPQQITAAQRVLHITCKPEGKDTKMTEITIRLKKK